MASPAEIRNMASRVRSSKHSIDNARGRFKSCADATIKWWKDGAEPTFTAGKNTTLGFAKDIVSELNTLDNKLLLLAEAVKKADDEKKAGKK